MKKLNLIKRTLDDLNKFYPIGLYDWMYLNSKSDYEQLIEMENRIDYLIINDGNENVFKDLLIEYWQIHKRNILEFNDSHNAELNVSEIRKERLEERVAS